MTRDTPQFVPQTAVDSRTTSRLEARLQIETTRNWESVRMANSPQSKKRARQNERRFAVNKARRSRIRTFLRKVEEAIASGDKDAAGTALRAAQPELMRGVTKGVFHKNTVARKMSRLSSRVKAIG